MRRDLVEPPPFCGALCSARQVETGPWAVLVLAGVGGGSCHLLAREGVTPPGPVETHSRLEIIVSPTSEEHFSPQECWALGLGEEAGLQLGEWRC